LPALAVPRAKRTVEEEPAKKRRCTASWTQLMAKVFHADPLACGKCGGEVKIVAYLHDQAAIKQEGREMEAP
jgi:hypothetical protein